MTREVIVNDKIQSRYVTGSVARDFAPESTEKLTRKQMLAIGVFGDNS